MGGGPITGHSTDDADNQRWILTIASIVGSYLLLFAAFRFLGWLGISLPGALHPLAAVPLAFGIAFGTTAAWGVAVATIVVGLVGLTVGVETPFVALAHAYLAFAGARLWAAGRTTRQPGRDGAVLTSIVKPYLLVGVLLAPGAAAIVAWGYVVGGIAPFYVTVVSELLTFALSSIVLGLPALIMADALARRSERVRGLFDGRVNAGRRAGRIHAGGQSISTRRIVVVSVGWIVLGGLGSVAYRTFERVPRSAFRARGLEWVYELGHSWVPGPGGARLQILFGAVMASLLLVGLLERYRRADHRDQEVTDATDSA